MEVLQNDDNLREEILNDAKNKADRIIKKAEREKKDILKDAEKQIANIDNEYKETIEKDIDEKLKIIFASVDIEVKKEISAYCGELVEEVYESVREDLQNDKVGSYSDFITKLLQLTSMNMEATAYIIEISSIEQKKIKKEHLLKLLLGNNKSKIKDVVINDQIDGIMLYTEDRKIAANISIDSYFEQLKKETRTKIYETMIKGK
jgi:vacuolar-type H+-ATPase subunit E/Vma4